MNDFAVQNNTSIEVLQVPHHGSRTGISKEIVDAIAPKLAVISVRKNNRYGHPSQEVLRMLREEGMKLLRTDQKGDIGIVSDGKRWWVE